MIYELPIYQQTNKNNVICIYCEECKPTGTRQRGILVVSTYDQFCDGCGNDFKEMAERKAVEG